ncbi:hypothetical protein IW262DRAFT_1346355 [Armillaria fumosa]|nr:hypothetical protein IW262DRAFT_1346355 [Armillaria fumosa]
MSPDVAQPGYRALPRSESDYPPSTMPRTAVNRSKKQEVTNHTQATLRPGSTQPGRMPRDGQSTKPSATDVPRTIDRPDTDAEKPSPLNRDRREAVSRPMSTPPKLSREQTERMVPHAVPERIRRVERRSEESPLSSQNHTRLLNRPEIPTKVPAQRTRAPLKHVSSHIGEAAPAASMDDVETSEGNVTGPVINDQHGSYLNRTGRYNDEPQNVGLPPEPYGHGNSPNRDDDMRILDEPRSRLLPADQVQSHVQITATGGLEPSTSAELWASSSDIPIQQGLDAPVITESPPPPYEEAVLQRSEGIDSVENPLGSSNETHPSSAHRRRRHDTVPEPPWDAELVAEFRNDPPGIVGHKFLLDRITDACEYTVLDETNGRFLIRAKYNSEQMVQKLRYSELDTGMNVRDVQAYFNTNPHRVRGAKLRVTGNDEKYKISAFYLEDGVRWFEITQRLTYGEMLRMIRLSRRWDMSL